MGVRCMACTNREDESVDGLKEALELSISSVEPVNKAQLIMRSLQEGANE